MRQPRHFPRWDRASCHSPSLVIIMEETQFNEKINKNVMKFTFMVSSSQPCPVLSQHDVSVLLSISPLSPVKFSFANNQHNHTMEEFNFRLPVSPLKLSILLPLFAFSEIKNFQSFSHSTPACPTSGDTAVNNLVNACHFKWVVLTEFNSIQFIVSHGGGNWFIFHRKRSMSGKVISWADEHINCRPNM